MHEADNLNCALGYEKLGFFVLPIHPTQKRSLISWADRKHQRPTPGEIQGWYKKYPDARVGIATGKLSAVDVIAYHTQFNLSLFKLKYHLI